MFINQTISAQFIQSLGWTLIHSIWQGFVLAAMAGIVILLTKRSSAALRYNLLVGLLFLFACSAAVTFVYEWNASSASAAVVATDHMNISVKNVVTGQQPVVSNHSVFENFKDYFNRNMPVIVLIWTLFFLIQFTRLLAGLYHIQTIRTRKLIEVGEAWKDKLIELSAGIGLTRAVQLFESALVRVPLTVGYLKPVILVPAGLLTNLDPAQVESILLHELAHIRRKDYLVNFLQSLLETIFFFNPALWWLSSLIRDEREACCDDIVVASAGDHSDYLRALVSFQEQAGFHQPALGLSSKKYSLFNRVKRMLTHENQTLNLMERSILILGIVVLSAFAFLPSAGQKSKNRSEEKKSLAAEARIATTAEEANREVKMLAVTDQTAPVATLAVSGEAITAIPVATETNPFGITAVSVTSAVVADTVPKTKSGTAPEAKPGVNVNTNTYTFTNITVNTSTNNNVTTSDISATGENGDVYRLKKTNGEITQFTVNGKEITPEERANYEGFMKAMDKRTRSNRTGTGSNEEEVIVDAQGGEVRAVSSAHGVHARSSSGSQNAGGTVEVRSGVHGQHSETGSHVGSGQGGAYAAKHSNLVKDVIAELLEKKIISSKANVSFSFKGSEFTVNGVKQDAATADHFTKKFGIKPGDTINVVVTNDETTHSVDH